MSKQESKSFDKYLKQSLMSPEEKYHMNKKQASNNITHYLHKLLVKIAPMSKSYLKKLSINNNLIDSILSIFKSNSAKYLYASCPVDSLNSTVFYLQYDDMYTGDANIESTKLVKSNYANRPDFLFTKNAKTEFNYLLKKGYKYVHFYEKLTWKPAHFDNEIVSESNKNIYTQFNIPTKRDILNMIRHIIYDVSMFNIDSSDAFALQDTLASDEKEYKALLLNVKNDKDIINSKKKKLKALKKHLKKHKEPRGFRHIGC